MTLWVVIVGCGLAGLSVIVLAVVTAISEGEVR